MPGIDARCAAGSGCALGDERWIVPYVRRFAERTGWCMLLLAALPVALRLRAAEPSSRSDAGYLRRVLASAGGRHAAALSPGESGACAAAVFRNILRAPGANIQFHLSHRARARDGHRMGAFSACHGPGCLLGVAAFCSLCYWMLRGWTTPAWALAGGLLAVIEFGPLSQWTNSYWGGALAAAAGCLVFGSLPRLRAVRRTCGMLCCWARAWDCTC